VNIDSHVQVGGVKSAHLIFLGIFCLMSVEEFRDGSVEEGKKSHRPIIVMGNYYFVFGITNLNVIMRYFFNSPIVFSVEMGRYCFVSIIFLGAIFTTREDRHIHVDFFTGMFPEKIQEIIAQFGRFLMVVFFGITTIYTCRMAMLNISVSSSAMKIPMAIPYGIMAFGCAGIVLESAINIIEFHLGLKKHKKNIEEEM